MIHTSLIDLQYLYERKTNRRLTLTKINKLTGIHRNKLTEIYKGNDSNITMADINKIVEAVQSEIHVGSEHIFSVFVKAY